MSPNLQLYFPIAPHKKSPVFQKDFKRRQPNTIVREIARGGMEQIYFGEDPQLKRQVAVNVSSISEGGEDPRFSKEATALAQLAHPSIVPTGKICEYARSLGVTLLRQPRIRNAMQL